MGSSEANRQYLRLNPLRDHEGEYAAGSAANQVLPPRAARQESTAKNSRAYPHPDQSKVAVAKTSKTRQTQRMMGRHSNTFGTADNC